MPTTGSSSRAASRPLHPLIRDEVYKIGREALVNAFRHSGARSIELELDYAPNRLRMLVRDDGGGIDPRILRSGSDGHWGVSGMRERADKLGAGFKISSRPGAGTEVELTVPAAIAFEHDSGRSSPRLVRAPCRLERRGTKGRNGARCMS